MARTFRWLLRIFVAVSLLALTGAMGIYWLAARSLPDYDATHEVAGLTGPVEIVRDHANVPHIFGDSDPDVFFGLGFAHAQDRLWQMTVMRRTAQGRLSELFGARTLRTDELLRRMDLYGAAVASVADQDAATRTALEAYAAGVNAWIDTVNEDALGRGAPEFFLFTPEIQPWRPADSIAIVKLMALQLTSAMPQEVLRARASLALSPERLRDILPDAPGTPVTALPQYGSLFPNLPANTPLVPRDGEHGYAMLPVPEIDLAGASNAWAAAPDRSAAGGSLLASDPHLGLSAPSIWYLARLELDTGGVIGGTIPGIPMVLNGRSDALGWGITATGMDDQDVFIEEVNPANPAQYRSPRGWVDFETRRSIIRVKDAAPVTVELRRTQNGPVMPGGHFGLANVTPPGHVAALAWTALDRDDRSLSAAMGLMHARTVDEAIDAMEDFVAPALNLTLADRSEIGFKMVGKQPSRSADQRGQGRIPSLGWQMANRWQGTLPYTENPEVREPASGILGNTNNKITDRPFPNHITFDWGDTQRIQRWQKLMQDRQVHTRESFIDAQLDTVSFTARSLLPLIAADLWFTGEAAEDGTPERQRQRALELLANWNGEMNEHLPEPLIYAAWLRQLQTRLIRDELGPLAAEFHHPDPIFIERVFRDIDGASAWCDVVQSAITETCTDLARIALDEALIWIGENHGRALESLRWGDAHIARHDHAVLGDVPVLKWIVNIRQSTSGGDNTLQRGQTIGTGPEPFANVHAAGYRGVYDLADPDSSLFVLATGQSGHPLSRHYDDLGELWRRGDYIPMSLDPELARAAAVGVTELIPE